MVIQDPGRTFRMAAASLAAGLWLLCVSPSMAVAEAADATSAYEAAVLGDGPVCWWRMSQGDGDAVTNHCSLAGDAELAAEPVGKVGLDVAGPRGVEFPDFAAGNVAVHLSAGRNYLRVADPGDASVLDFDNGDAITPLTRSASTTVAPSSSPSQFAAAPTNNAECDHVDCVRYLMAVLIRVLPSTSRMSPGSRMARRFSTGVTENCS